MSVDIYKYTIQYRFSSGGCNFLFQIKQKHEYLLNSVTHLMLQLRKNASHKFCKITSSKLVTLNNIVPKSLWTLET